MFIEWFLLTGASENMQMYLLHDEVSEDTDKILLAKNLSKMKIRNRKGLYFLSLALDTVSKILPNPGY